ncbi:hypothetical protein IGI37_001391 [Enterococcus sp. AZ194]|uniref:DNA alkylation repair protein n=1 Tax=Enterococcus sp. AZ194 TaxID=2774629 RepID=UPI003F2377E0
MPELMKDMYNATSLQKLAEDIHSVYRPFKINEFLSATMDAEWQDIELKGRVRKVSTTIGAYLTSDYRENLQILDQVVANFSGFFGTVFPDFVEVYGQATEDWEVSIATLKNYTQYSSSEFAIRPFIAKQPEKMLKLMLEWTQDENEHIRRLSSEGCRSQLPWAQSIPELKKNPVGILPILEELKADTSKYVQKSVANSLNDISKTHPELVVPLVNEWYGKRDETNWIVKHGCRTLLKKGNREILALFGYHDGAEIQIMDFTPNTTSLAIGEELTFSFSVQVEQATKVRLEYGVDYVKANGKRNRKIFRISETSLKEQEKKLYTKKQAFADLSTRKHYPGLHTITLIVNGVERGKFDFELSE